MCGRFTLAADARELEAEFGHVPPGYEHRPRFNIAPSQTVLTLVAAEAAPRLTPMRWGLIPAWADGPGVGQRLINARSETAAQKPAFRSAFRHRRCLIPVDGFFEWQRLPGGRKQPFRIRSGTGGLFTLAGLWDEWTPATGEPVRSFTILTTEANSVVRPIHQRMPVILPAAQRQLWLAPAAPTAELQALLQTPAAEELAADPVSELVNSPRNDVLQCIIPLLKS